MTEAKHPSRAEIQHAASLLRAGWLVAFPTETVYGLGANALDEAAVRRIFEAKGRPGTSPIIVHVSSIEMARVVAREWPEAAQRLTHKFWPGPLTLVLKKQPAVPAIVSAGLDTVGVRMPSHPVALALIEAAQVPVAAPSANRFTQLSPTTAQHVREGLGDRVDYVLDGGPCTVGIESTVLSLAEDHPALLRPGGISREQVEAVIGPVTQQTTPTAAAHPSPGMHPRHYSPRTKLLLVRDGEVPEQGTGAYLRIHHPPRGIVREVVEMPPEPREYAARLYQTLHDLDVRGYDWIAVEAPPDTPEWEAVRDRLTRAAG
ncbi:MAG TPA: L-threonylcarbamoyladenylate synthase [Terriglobales bacterium]|jgi:L-threonylcarbamoyladenylate synthase|nr:L-threonylcarbamoyladenylate synthase [Terriglobales bacterium]